MEISCGATYGVAYEQWRARDQKWPVIYKWAKIYSIRQAWQIFGSERFRNRMKVQNLILKCSL